MNLKKNKKTKIPLFVDKVFAGFPSPAENHIEKELDLHELLVDNPSSTFIVRATGNSMVEAGIHSGDLMVVDKSIKPENGSIIIASINGEFTVKKIEQKNNELYLVPANKNYNKIKINEFDDFEVWGVITHTIHSFKRRHSENS